jgi:hypothetical protein
MGLASTLMTTPASCLLALLPPEPHGPTEPPELPLGLLVLLEPAAHPATATVRRSNGERARIVMA